MNLEIENTSSTCLVLKLTVSADEIANERAQVVKSIASSANIPGFRKGKAPAAVIEKRFADKIAEQTDSKVCEKAYNYAVEQKKDEYTFLGINEFKDHSTAEDGSMNLAIEVSVVKNFELPALEGIPVDNVVTPTTDEEVDGIMKNIAHNYAKNVELTADDTLQAEDMVTVNYKGFVDGKPLAEAYPECDIFSQKDEVWMTVDSEYARIPGMQKDLVGKKIGDETMVEITFPEDFYKKELSGVKASYTYTIVKGSRQVLPTEWTPEMLKNYFAKDEAELRENFRERFKAHHENEDKNRHCTQIVDFLVKNTSFDVPEKILERETEAHLDDLIRRQMDYGVSKEDLASKKEELTKQAREIAEKTFRFDLITDAVVAKLSLEYTMDEFNQFMTNVARSQRMTQKQMQDLAKDRAALRRYYRDGLQAKMLMTLLEKATSVEKL